MAPLTFRVGCRIEYLSPYSPDFNPIELAFSIIKREIQRQGQTFLYANSPQYELLKVCNVITPEIAKKLFHHCGY